uniref:Acyl-CoA_dh_1 domain-containing protein n=1 Tax=Steinernema glaseri TaxID=37863 RepID=A0A1I7ZHP3_9BILA
HQFDGALPTFIGRAFHISQNAGQLGQPATHGMTQNGFAIARAVARAMDNSYTAHTVLQTGAQKVVQPLARLFQIRAMQIQAGLNGPTVAFQIAQDIGATAGTQMS